AERHDGAPVRAVRVRDGERAHRPRRRRPDDRRERGHQGVLPRALRRRAAEELSRREALPPAQAVAVINSEGASTAPSETSPRRVAPAKPALGVAMKMVTRRGTFNPGTSWLGRNRVRAAALPPQPVLGGGSGRGA